MKGLYFALAMCAVTSCGTTAPTVVENNFTEKEYAIAANTATFATELFHSVYKSEKGSDNFCISPVSASWALSMAANGASGITAAQMYAALGFKGVTTDTINLFQQKSVCRLATLDPEAVKVGVANSAWVDSNFKVEKDFIRKNRTFYDAAVKNLPFGAAAVKQINDWCAEKTAGKISEIIKELSPSSRMVLVNALYFNARWKAPFIKSRTIEDTFTKENGEKVKVQMMRQKFDTQYYEDENVQMASKPFGRGIYSMYFILPREGVSMDKAAEELAANFTLWCDKSERYEVDLSLPRFKSEYGTSLKKTLQAMGIEKAFTPGVAEFRGISKEDIYIGNVLQNTFIKVDEEGAEAAAVTSVMLEATALGPPETKKMKIDRPFFYAIRENGSGNILFIGKNGHPRE